MILSKVNSILSKHPFFKTLSDDQKIGIYNKIYTKIFYIRSDTTVINPVTYSTDKSYLLYYKFPDFVNLSAQKDVDSLMNQDSLLKNLTDEQKIVVFEVAAYRINMYRTLREDQEYYFSTHKGDVTTKQNIFTPILTVIGRILTQTIKSYIYEPLAIATAKVITTLNQTKYYEPALIASSKIWGALAKIYTYEPLVEVQAFIKQTQNIVVTYLPSLTVSNLILANISIINTYNPLLSVSHDIIEDADYIKTYIYEPSLIASSQVLAKV